MDENGDGGSIYIYIGVGMGTEDGFIYAISFFKLLYIWSFP